MILKKKYYDGLLCDLKQLILNNFGLDLTFEQKEMDNYLDVLDDHIKPSDDIIVDTRYLIDQDRLLNDDTVLIKTITTFF